MNIKFYKEVIESYLCKLIADKAEGKIAPILDNFLLTVTNEEVSIYSTSLQLFSIINLPIKSIQIIEVGSVLIPINKFLSFIKYANPDDLIEIVSTDKIVKIKYQNAKLEVLTNDKSEYPNIFNPTTKLIQSYKFNLPIIESMYNYIKNIIYEKADRPELKTIGITLYNNKVTFITTDMVRLGTFLTNLETTELQSFTLYPALIAKLITGYKPNEVIINNYEDNIVEIKQENVKFYCRVLDYKFPSNLENLKPTEFESEITLNRFEFIKALKQISAIEDLSDTRVLISIANSNINLVTRLDENNAQTYLPFNQDIKDIDVYLNLKLLLEILNSLTNTQVTLQLNKSKPCIIKQPITDNLFYLMMPLKIY